MLRLLRLFKLLFHTLGISCLGGAVFIEALVFTDILQQGYFYAIETGPFILTLELLLTIYAAIYLVYTFYRLMKRLESKPLISTTKTTTKIIQLKREALFYRIIALIDVLLFIIIIFTEGILNHTLYAISAFTVAFFILFIGIGAQQRANTIKMAFWYHENRHLLRSYRERFGESRKGGE